MNQSLENDFHLVAYLDDFNNIESLKKLKSFRKFHTKNTDKFFHFKYWVVDNKELAKKLKINTDEEVGNVYMVRQSTEFNFNKKNINLCGYDFHCEKILTAKDTFSDSKHL
jgi:anthranilate/para-aminobenzoate synthase component II